MATGTSPGDTEGKAADIPPQLPPTPKHQSMSTFGGFAGSSSSRFAALNALMPKVEEKKEEPAPEKPKSDTEVKGGDSKEEKKKDDEKK